MEETKYIWMDGKLVDWHDAKVHVLTHTLHYGLGVFEGIRFYKSDKGPVIFRLKEHIDRLFEGAEVSFMKVPFSKEEIISAVLKTVRENEVDSGYIRPLIYYGYGKMGLNPAGAPVRVAIAVWPWGSYLGDKAISVKTSKFMRIHPDTTHAHAKICGHYVNSIFASFDAKDNGFNEALLLDYKGNAGEGPGENIFIVKDGRIYTPNLGSILSGITRRTIIEISKDLGYEVIEKDLSIEEIKDADEAFFTGTAAEVSVIGSVDDKEIGDGSNYEISYKIKAYYLDIVSGNIEKYHKWLSYVNE